MIRMVLGCALSAGRSSRMELTKKKANASVQSQVGSEKTHVELCTEDEPCLSLYLKNRLSTHAYQVQARRVVSHAIRLGDM